MSLYNVVIRGKRSYGLLLLRTATSAIVFGEVMIFHMSREGVQASRYWYLGEGALAWPMTTAVFRLTSAHVRSTGYLAT